MRLEYEVVIDDSLRHEGYTYQQEHGVDVKDSYIIKYCDKCGQKLSPNASFCHNCGAPLKEDLKCKTCGFLFVREGKYCPNCGTKRS
jgi:uncharacterized OB-fold protein